MIVTFINDYAGHKAGSSKEFPELTAKLLIEKGIAQAEGEKIDKAKKDKVINK